MQLALFDLDFTLIDFDSGLAWMEFLVERGASNAGTDARHLEICQAYVDGQAELADLHRSTVLPLQGLSTADVGALAAEFARHIAHRLPRAALKLVQDHQGRGDLCALVTATSQIIATPVAHLFGLEHVLATRPARADGHVNGEIDGAPCHGEQKTHRLHQWLAARGQPLGNFERSWFYSDAASDLPLLDAVTDPVVVRPDPRLRAIATARGWPLLELSSKA